MAALDRALPADAILIEEAVTNRFAVARQVARQPGRHLQTGAPALGWAVGAAVGVKLARPEAPVVVVCGDGSVTVILNNRSYHASRRPVATLYPEGAAVRGDDFPETALTPEIDYPLLARACGGEGRAVETPAELGDALAWALDEAGRGRCAVLDARLPPP